MFRKLHDYRVLPFIDLKIWEKCENKQIKNSTIATALFPDGDAGEYEIRTKTKKFVEKIMDEAFLNAI
jgi:hypothetical protein